MQPFITGEPGNAPAWYLRIASAAVMVPSRLHPTFTVIEEPEVGPVPLNTSSRDMFIRTGWPDSFESVSATGSRYTMVLPPKPPPISAGLTLTSPMVMPVSFAVRLRTAKCPWLELQISALPPPSQFARHAWGSMYAWWIGAVR